MGLLDTMIDAYMAPERKAEEQAAFSAQAPQRTADAWSKVVEQNTPRPDQNGQPAVTRTPMERWKSQIDLMMQSGDQTLQTQAMKMLQSQNEKSLAPAPKLSSYGQQAVDMGFTPGTEGFKKMVRKLSTKTAYESSGDKPMTGVKGYMMPDGTDIPFGMTVNEAKAAGVVPKKTMTAGDSGKMAMLGTAAEGYPIIDEKLYDESGNINQDVIRGMSAIEHLPFGSGSLVTKYMSPDAQEVYQAFETGMQAITRTETGAAMASEEISNTKKRFMPQPFDTPAAQAQKIKAYKYFIDNAIDLIDPTNEMNDGLDPKQRMERAVSRSFNETAGETTSWKSGGYEYRKTPDGKTQRRKL